ncbi:MAG: PAS domain S-box protein [Acetobacteraceae bacterium]|nr:PAS domain S-box protein [Acetobacteraceae bacterium]
MALPSFLLLLIGSVVAVPIQAELLRLARRALPGATEHKRMEAALAESEARFRVIADSLPHLAWLARPDGSISWCNQRWLDYAGVTQEQMRVRGWHALQHPDHLERIAARIRRSAESGGPWEDSFPLRRADGEWRWFHVHVLPVRDAAGRILHWFGTGTDMTERRQAEQALAASERRLRDIVAAVPVLLRETDAAGTCTWLNDRWYAFTGQERLHLPGNAWLDMVHPEDRAAAERDFRDAIARQASFRAEYRLRRADGGWCWVLDAAEPRFAEDGSYLGHVGSVLDIADRREAEERQALLAREMDHRAKNTMAVVRSLVQLSPRNVPPEEFVAALEGRLSAMARAHGLLAKDRWRGAGLREILAEELASWLGGQDGPQVLLDGPMVRLPPDSVQPVGMILHELATNSAKHGALSARGGRVTLTWGGAADGGLWLAWQEAGGPQLARPPQRRGFGSRLIQATARHQLGGAVEFRWEPGGLCCRLQVPPRCVTSIGQATASVPAPTVAGDATG